MPKRFFIIRHGQTLFNAQRKLQGQCNSPLTTLGQTQAQRVGKTLKAQLGAKEYEFYSSSLGRAVETSLIIAQQLDVSAEKIQQDDRLKEFSLGDWEEKPISDILDQQPNLLEQEDWFITAPNSEPFSEVQGRIYQWLDSIDHNTDSDVVVVCHGLTSMVLRGILLDLNYEQTWQQAIPQDAFFVIENGKIQRIEALP